MDPTGPLSNSATLYVGDLHPDVSESMLFSKFSTAGPVASIRVFRDMITRRSLGYAYVNFSQPADAKRAMSTMNNDTMNGRPIRLMCAQWTIVNCEDTNVFIKNLDKSIDNQALYGVFSPFGNIVSCKVAEDGQGSKGYGYVHFDTGEAAKQAIEKVNGMMLKGKKVDVEKFIPRRERLSMMDDKAKTYNNVYIKNFGHEYDDDKLKVDMEKFGKVMSAKVHKSAKFGEPGFPLFMQKEDSEGHLVVIAGRKPNLQQVMTDHQNISRGFGFVCFEDPEDAEKCVDQIMGSELNGKILYASPAERDELKEKFEGPVKERVNGNQGVNLYVKNLDSCIDDERLRKEFSEFGTITSAKVMGDGVRSKGFGFVCFSSPEEATKAVTEMNGRIIVAKPLYVALAQRKEDRRAHLAPRYMQRITTMRQQQSAQYSQMFQPSGAGYFVPQQPQAARGFFTPTQMPQVQASPRWQTQVRQPAPAGASFQAVQGNQLRPARFQGSGQQGVRANMNAGPITGQAGGQPGGQRMTGPGMPRGPPGAAGMAAPQIEASMFDEASPTKQRQMLGNRLFPRINDMYPELACKLTEMLLQIDKSELLDMLESPEALRDEVENAVSWLNKRNRPEQS